MNTQSSICTESEPESSENIWLPKQILEKISKNLSCTLSSTALDITHTGILLYDPYSIEETPSIPKLSKPFKAISLRSKSTRNLTIRKHSYSSLLKSFKLVLEKVEVDELSSSKNLDEGIFNKWNRSRSKQKLDPISEKKRKKNRIESKPKKFVLEDLYNLKPKKSQKSFKNTSKETLSRKNRRFSRVTSLTPNKIY